MNKKILKPSCEFIFWGGFGAGGMWTAIFSPILILLTTIVLPIIYRVATQCPVNSVDCASVKITENIFTFLFSSPIGLLLLLATIVLSLWCGMHRIHHLLHDLKIHLPYSRFIFYGSAIALSLLAFYYTVSIYLNLN